MIMININIIIMIIWK